MRFLFACLCALLVSQATCMTNREFADLMLESSDEADTEELYPGDEGFDDPDDDATELPGGPDDELDVEYLMIQTGLPDKLMSQLTSMSKTEPEGSSLGWWRRRRRRRRGGRRKTFSCNCHRRSCHCCIHKTFKVSLIIKKIRYRLNACAYITYTKGVDVKIKLTLGRRTMFRKTISIRHPPALCTGLPGFKWFARVCLRLYNVNIRRKSFCIRIEGRLNLLFKRFRVHIKIGCYRLGALNEKELAHMMNDTTAMTRYLSNMDNTMIERFADLFQADIETLPELMQYVEFTEITDNDVTGDVNDAGDFVEQMEIEDFEN